MRAWDGRDSSVKERWNSTVPSRGDRRAARIRLTTRLIGPGVLMPAADAYLTGGCDQILPSFAVTTDRTSIKLQHSPTSRSTALSNDRHPSPRTRVSSGTRTMCRLRHGRLHTEQVGIGTDADPRERAREEAMRKSGVGGKQVTQKPRPSGTRRIGTTGRRMKD